MRLLRCLIACEFSGIVRSAFERRGWEAWSCDFLPTEIPSLFHHRGDVRDIIEQPWDLLIGHPPCTYLTNAGVRHLHSVPSRNGVLPKIHGEKRWQELRNSAIFFNSLQDADIHHICIENPTPHKYAKELIGAYTHAVQPWQFGHGETKRTCFWLKNLPPLQPTNVVDGRYPMCHKCPPSKDRWKIRSMTYPGIAEAMADQWTRYIENL